MHFGYSVYKAYSIDRVSRCDSCGKSGDACHQWKMIRTSPRTNPQMIMSKEADKDVRPIASLCGRRCAKRYACEQFALMRLQGKI